ncbi:CYTH domain-containing protein [Consotaella salsifontis]|uniref:CYTH domain-containing protein n=1 Tax=Consotaella salsifontis TaxID=1365950 RepID=A0A1T4QT91_9HYPH|nr:CYTH domain-containing protein [Consotaella salsifontis]SKA06914.1 CYTH domain-containing protein [Consotaella salsifontis]
MAQEIERRFLVKNDDWRRTADAGEPLLQFYLAARETFSARVRIKKEASAVLTLKTGAGMAREEMEYPIPLEDARHLEGSAVGTVIRKRRHRLAHDGHTIEIDVFSGDLAPLVIAEVEFAEGEATDIALPDFFGREVTDDGAYTNASLALEGLPATFSPKEQDPR